MEKGIVFDIQRFCVHDGPGIRTTVFLKGCPLRCAWCHNPESWRREPEPLVKENGQTKLCGQEMTVGEVMDEVMVDYLYYRNSEGGVTLSGGEPMAQFEFTRALLQDAKRRGLHTCIETSGYAQSQKFNEIMPYVDLFLYDIKGTDPQAHKAHTGVGNRLILDNLELLHRNGAQILLRCPIIPGVNDSDTHLSGVAQLTERLPGISGVEIMPYHDMGKGKWKELGRKYSMSELKTVCEEEKQNLLCRFREAGCRNVTI